jgi:hypothetical protein
MKKPANLSESASRIWDVYEAWQRIDLRLARSGCKFSRKMFRERYRARLRILRTGTVHHASNHPSNNRNQTIAS